MNTNESNFETLQADYFSCPMITDMHLLFENEIVTQKHRIVGFCCRAYVKVPRTALGETGEETIQNYLSIRKTLLQESHHSLDAQERTVSKGCAKCPAYRKMKRKPSEKITLINFSPYPSPCNARCIYCNYQTDKYEFSADEEKAYHVIFDTVEYAQTAGLVSSDVAFDIFSGEIAIHPYKQRILDIVGNNQAKFATNCFLFDEQISKNLRNNFKSKINLSIDCGTKETWKKIKGAGNFDKVIENLSKYRENCVRGDQIFLKYIIMPGINDNIKDFAGCIELMKNLSVNHLHIACDNRQKYSTMPHENEKLMKAAAMFIMMLRYNGLTEIIQPTYKPQQKKRIEELTRGLI